MANIGTASVYSGLTATGSTQATAYAVKAESNYFSTVDSGTGAILDVATSQGESQTIYNGGANDLSVYPPSTHQINALGTNAAMLLSPRTACEFRRLTATVWTGILSR